MQYPVRRLLSSSCQISQPLLVVAKLLDRPEPVCAIGRAHSLQQKELKSLSYALANFLRRVSPPYEIPIMLSSLACIKTSPLGFASSSASVCSQEWSVLHVIDAVASNRSLQQSELHGV